MIAKLSTGNGFGGALSYLLRNGKSDEERAKVKVLAASGVDFTFDSNGNIVLDTRQVARDFRFQSMMMPSVRKPVYDIALSWKKGEHVPSDEKLARTEEFLQMIGFGNTQFIIVEHEKENEHSHAIANIVDKDGNRISTKDLIDRMHAAAREITKKYGYQWGDTAKKETIERAHKPHEQARYTIEPTVKAAVAKANDIQDLPGLLNPSGINCRIKYSDDGKPVGISFSVEMEGQLHTFKGRDLDRSLSAGNIAKSIADRLAQEEANRTAVLKELARQQQEAKRKAEEEQHKKEEAETRRKAEVNKARDMIAGYNSIILPMCREKFSLITVRKNAYQLMKAVDEAKIAVSKETSAKFEELKDTWNDFNRLNQERQETKEASGKIAAIGGMLMLFNPIIGLTVMFLAMVANDIRQSEIKAQKKQLLARVVSIRSEISQLQEQKAQLKIEKQERLQEYLEAKQMLKEYNEGLETVDQTVHDARIEMLKEEFPFQGAGHLQYIVHSSTDASIFHAGEESNQYKKVPTGEYDVLLNGTQHEKIENKIETARCMLKDKGYMVANDRGPDEFDGFYESLLREQEYKDFRIGSMFIQPDGKVIFGEEKIFGHPEKTAPALKYEPEPLQATVVQQKVKEPQPAPAVKPEYNIVASFSDGVNEFRIKKEADGTCKLQHLDWDKTAIDNGKYTKKRWYNKAKFTSFSEIDRDSTYLYLKIKDLAGKTRYINQYGVDLSSKQLHKLGLGESKGYSGPSW